MKASVVRDALKSAISSIAQTELGFDDVGGNVKSYLLEQEAELLRPAYLFANVDGGSQLIRAWGVSVFGADSPYALGGVKQRIYSIRVEGYYQIEPEGAAVEKLMDHANKVQTTLNALNSDLGLGVRVVGMSAGFPDVISAGVAEGVLEVLRWSLSIEAQREGTFE